MGASAVGDEVLRLEEGRLRADEVEGLQKGLVLHGQIGIDDLSQVVRRDLNGP